MLPLLAIGLTSFAPARAQNFIPVGVQENVPVATVTGAWGWYINYQGLYDARNVPIADLFAGVQPTDFVMYAARPTGAANFTLLAAGLAADVRTVTAINATTTSNGLVWYYNDQSIGFAGLGDTINQDSADVTSSMNDNLRLSWHTTGDPTGPTAMNDGWRAGINTDLNGATDWERFVLVGFPPGPPPEELSAVETGLPMANALGQMLISGNQTATSDVNNHMFGLMAGDGEEAANSSLSASLDEGVVIGQGDGPEDPIARKVLRSRQWEVYTTVNYGYLDLNALGGQAGVNVESWAPGIGIERHLSRGLAVGFAVSFLQSWQDYSGGLGSLDLEGPALSAYLTFVRKNYWSSLLYSFGSYELDSTRNPGLGFPQAYGSTHSYTNSVQYNTGWNFRFQNNTLLTGPFAGIDYLHGTVDAYSETGGGAAALRYAEQSYESLVTRVGWSASKKIKTDFASITPPGALEL